MPKASLIFGLGVHRATIYRLKVLEKARIA
jgi:hypothetical protein